MAEGDLQQQRRTALQELLDRPVVERTGQPEAFRCIARHEGYVRGWFAARPRWRVVAGRGSYRLERLPSRLLPERGLPRLRTPLDYACLAWCLWFAEVRATEPRRWFVLSELAADVRGAAEGQLDLGQRPHRESLVRALQLLVDLGVLLHRDGDAERWVSGEAELGQGAEVLYEFAEDAPRLLAGVDPRALPDPAAPPPAPELPAVADDVPPAARAWRALLLGPLLWRRDDPEAFAALQAAAGQVAEDVERDLGWQLEVQADYARLWRDGPGRGPAAVLVDLAPEAAEGTERHVRYAYHPVLLLVAALRAAAAEGRLAREPDGALAVSAAQLSGELHRLYGEHRRNWGAELGGQLSFAEVQERVFRQMRAMGYLRGPDALGRCWLLPAAAAFAGAYATPPPEAPAPPPAGPRPRALGLFGDDPG